ncbi:hypothetical protein BY458DRAFT_475018 [Sporodiniella umbellata]|nr:hypothetical protein BY458DRAFT_475018 [Sporodiniella umbellata]
MRWFYFFLGSLFAVLVQAVDLEGKIVPNVIIPDISNVDPITTRVTLNGAQHMAHVRSNGQFTIYDVQPGSYLLEIQSIKYEFPKIRIDVKKDEPIWAAFTGLGRDWNQFGNRIAYPLEIPARAEADYFVQQQGFDVMSILGNKMFLMMGVSGLMMLFMPKMMKQMQEMNQEMAEEAKRK